MRHEKILAEDPDELRSWQERLDVLNSTANQEHNAIRALFEKRSNCVRALADIPGAIDGGGELSNTWLILDGEIAWREARLAEIRRRIEVTKGERPALISTYKELPTRW